MLNHEHHGFPSLRTLKLRQTALSDQAVDFLVSLCPNLTRLDLSFTMVRKLSLSQTMPPLEKLSLTSTPISMASLLVLIPLLPQLRILSLAALRGGSAAIGNSSEMTMSDQTLDALTDILAGFQSLESISLVGNTKLGSKEGLSGFIHRVGRKCKVCGLGLIQPSLMFF